MTLVEYQKLYSVVNELIFTKLIVAVAAYIRLTSRSQAKIPKQSNFATTSIFSAQPHLRRPCGLLPNLHFNSHLATEQSYTLH